MLKVLVSHNLRVFCAEGGRAVQRDLTNITRIEDVLCLNEAVSPARLQTLGGEPRWLDIASMTIDRAVPTGALQVEYHGRGHYSLQYAERYGRANHVGTLDFVAEHRNLWETFKLLDVATFRAAVRLASHQWVIGGRDDIATLDLRASDFESVSFAGKRLPMEAFFGSAATSDSALRFIFFDTWKVYEAHLLNPALVLVVFGHGTALQQYAECIESIHSLGAYQGKIFLISNVDEDHLRGLAPAPLRPQIDVISMRGLDQLDYVGARLAIFDGPHLDAYQPILYSDVDIVFDRPVEAFLIDAAKARQCSAQVEPFHRIATSEHTGARLIQEDVFPCDGLPGFNGGLLLVPNMEMHGRSLRAAYQTLVRYSTEFGRDSIPFYDQSVLNYTLYKLQDFNGAPVSPYTQIGGCDHPVDPHNPRGFVHFWNTPEKHLAMRQYINGVKDARNSGR